ncbi:hypothetical protein BOM24_01475 [Tatumella sp. OPLPL6]|nr:hypothetical protein BOM24_01475 [Tatumella sp. OPLPL6]
MCIEFLRSEVVEFLASYYLFTLSSDERSVFLSENGFIDDDSCDTCNKQVFNEEILGNYRFSSLMRNEYLEERVRAITGNVIKIINYPDQDIVGVPCEACGFIVYDNHEDSLFEVCPVCGWQTDLLDDNGYSKLNKSNLNAYRESSLCKDRLLQYEKIYVRK